MIKTHWPFGRSCNFGFIFLIHVMYCIVLLRRNHVVTCAQYISLIVFEALPFSKSMSWPGGLGSLALPRSPEKAASIWPLSCDPGATCGIPGKKCWMLRCLRRRLRRSHSCAKASKGPETRELWSYWAKLLHLKVIYCSIMFDIVI